MTTNSSDAVTVLLKAAGSGDETAPEKLLAFVYDDLRRLAAKYMRDERSDHTLQATALVHEAFVRLVNWEDITWENRAQFFAVAAQVMRNILIDHARAKKMNKRFGQKISLDEAVGFSEKKDFDLLKLEDALQTLAKNDVRQAKIVELRFFGGLSIKETAYILKISESTVKREWIFARAWLQRELTNDFI